jgi:predicted O-linked N-acetylglucosamine transferase (SPINDLY family)
MDYLVADATLIPPWSRADFGLPEPAFVFCSFNNVYKITPVTFDCWMRIPRRVEGSVLWLIEDNDTAISNLRAAVRSRGVDPARLIFSSRLLAPDHLARHRLANLFIDTFPCNAHTTASDALWAGLPVLTRAGESFPARVAASLVNAIGLPELVAGSLAQYEELAVQLAQDPVQLAGIAQRLKDNRLTAPLFDTDSCTRNLEQAYSHMYERYQADAALEDIYISC